MKKSISKYLFLFLIACSSNTKETVPLAIETIRVPAGFSISLFAENIENARSMTISDDGKTIFVGTRQSGNVYALQDLNGDGKADKTFTLAKGLRMPNGVAFKDGDLYVAEVSRILKFKGIEKQLNNPKYEVVYDQYPTNAHHGWKYIAFGPDGYLYVPVGAPCNICESEKEIFASITRFDVKNPNATPEIFAKGVRNTVGFAWHPKTKELWFTDNGRDMMGDDLPDCELNKASKKGLHFGYPYWHAGDVKDPDFGSKGKSKDAYEAPMAKLGAHTAPLGMKFYSGNMFPKKFENSIFIAKHGSWNRSKKVGYNVVNIQLDANNKVIQETVFAEGWLNHATQEISGRPVDILQLPDGSILVSDDVANCIYRITYKK
jgi:glucose/arabinose dehydrogenase